MNRAQRRNQAKAEAQVKQAILETKTPLSNFVVEFSGKMWKVLELSTERNYVKLQSTDEDKKVIERELDNENIFYYGV